MLKEAPKVVFTGLQSNIGDPKDISTALRAANSVELLIQTHKKVETTPSKENVISPNQKSTMESMKQAPK